MSDSRSVRHWALLGAVLALSFSVPLVGMFFLPARLLHVLPSHVAEEDALFPSPVALQGPEAYLSITPGHDLQPDPAKDFLLTLWFKLPRVPENGKKVILLSKYDRAAGEQSGYMLAVSRTAAGVRPLVYWKLNGARGKWYAFPEMNFVPRAWSFFALSLQKGRYLGLHTATRLRTGFTGPDLLGGYDLAAETMPASAAPLKVGVVNQAEIKSRIGPLGVFVKRNITGDLDRILKEMIADPAALPDYFRPANVRLWVAGGKQDQARNPHAIEISDRRRLTKLSKDKTRPGIS